MEQNVWHVVYLHHSSAQQRTRLEKAIHEELCGTGEDLYQIDRDIKMWFSLNYARLILSKSGGIPMTPPNFLFKHRVQVCKCLRYTHCLSQKYPMYLML